MNIYLLELLSKLVRILFVSMVSLFNSFSVNTTTLNVTNTVINKSLNANNKIIQHTTQINYNAKLPSNLSKVITPGIDGVVYVDENNNQKVLREMVPEVVEQGTGDQGEYVGKLSAYGPDCAGCSKVGNVACYTREGKKHSLKYDGIYYNDYQYGEVRILSAAREKFPCGTIIQIDNGKVEPYYAVVLDSGASMVNAWKKGTVWIDLAYGSSAAARAGNTSGNHVKFSVQRWGW